MTTIIIAAMICAVVVFAIIWFTYKGLPEASSTKSVIHYTTYVDDDQPEETHIDGFTVTPTEEPEEKVDPKKEQEAMFRDAASTISALLRGEVDFDEFKH